MPRFLFICLLVSTLSAAAGEPPAQVVLSWSGQTTETTLPQRGSDILRWKWLVRLYHVSLYLAPTAEDVISSAPKRLRMDYLRTFSRDDMVRATELTIGRNLDATTLKALQPWLEIWNASYPTIAVGDCLEFDHLPGGILLMRHNGMLCGSLTHEGFARALFAIWLGPNPVDVSVRDQLIRSPQRK